MKRLFFVLFTCMVNLLYSQEMCVLQGRIQDTNGNPVPFVTVTDGRNSSLSENDGSYKFSIPQNTLITIYFSRIGYVEHSVEFNVNSASKTYSPILKINKVDLPKVKIQYDAEREDNVTRLSSEKTQSLAGLSLSGVEGGLKTFAGVNTKSELSSQYSVRGGSYDENLVYVNGVPAFKPSMARSDKQEGLSIINPYMVESVDFSSGGFDIQYGDKMSSVLNVTYKDVEAFQVQADASLMDANITAQGINKSQKLSILAGGRYKNTSLILNTLDETGEYKPVFYDFQSMLKYDVNPQLTISYWLYGANNTYSFLPEKRETDFGSEIQSYRMTIYFEGEEKYKYQNLGNSLSFRYRPTDRTILDFKTLYYRATEDENFDVLSQYRLSESYNNGEKMVEDSTAILAVGSFLEHGRNKLKTNNLTFMHDGRHIFSSLTANWGFSVSKYDYAASYNEWTYIDSANYALPYSDTVIQLKNTANGKVNHQQNVLAGYTGISKRFYFDNEAQTSLKFNLGIRGTYDSYSEKILLNPRCRVTLKPNDTKKNQLMFATGIYYQPAEYKELVDASGTFYENVKPQKSTHFVLGYTQMLQIWKRPFVWHTELYTKILRDVIPYTIDNVSTVYYPQLVADGNITGLDTKLNGEFVPGIESWVNLSFMKAREHLKSDSQTEIRRANDQLVNFSMFFQDFLPGSERMKMNLTFIVGSNLPTAIPNATYKDFDAYTISPYTRLDIGFLFVVFGENIQQQRERHIKDMSLGLEIFNLFDNANKISYFWIEDVTNKFYAVPNYLTSRRVNLKLSIKI